MSVDWSRFAETIAPHQRWLLTSHMRPDCDALGSELGMAGLLEALGKQVLIVNGDQTPAHLRFIDPDQRIRTLGPGCTPAEWGPIDALMVLDTSAWSQLGPMAEVVRALGAVRCVVDHHVSSDDLGAVEFKDVTAEATGRLVTEAAEALGVAISPAMAGPLFAALATDTGWFRFSSTTERTFAVGARLVAAGARPDTIYRQLYEQDRLQRLLLVGRVLSGARTELEGRLIYAGVRQSDLEATGATAAETDNLVNLTLAVAGTEVALLFVELASGGAKVSIRSRGGLDCSRLAEQFGGGGHKAAAGATLQMPYDTAVERMLDAVRTVMR